VQPIPTQQVTLTVETTKHGNDPIVWEMSDGLKSGGPGNYPVVTVLNKAKADFTITINNPGTTTFSNDPIWIQKDTKPTQHVVHGIKDISGGGATVLKFHDGNMNAERLFYVLNFANVPAGTPAQLDPIIENQGGGPGMIGGDAYSAYYIGAAAVLLLALVAFILYRRRSATRPAAPRPTDLNES
jgi:hypothetical protein